MLMTLIKKECKMLSKSLIYYIYIALIVIMFFTQMGSATVTKPIEGMEEGSYGYKQVVDEDMVINETLSKLGLEFSENKYTTYPFMFYKGVKLSDKKQVEVETLFKTMVLWNEEEDFGDQVRQMFFNGEVLVKESLTYDEFREKMIQVDEIIGGSSVFSEEWLSKGTRVPMTYEDALNEYESIVENDQVTRALARLFADYMGIDMAIYPAFVVIFRILLDKKNKTKEVIASRKASSLTLVVGRYISFNVMMVLPVLVISMFPLSQGMYSANVAGVNGDVMAFVKVTFGWLLPTIMFVTALSYLLTEIFNSFLPVLIHIGIWFIQLNSASTLDGYVKGSLIPRFNTLGDYDLFTSIYDALVLNRICYTGASLVIVLLTVWVYSLRREGKVRFGG